MLSSGCCHQKLTSTPSANPSSYAESYCAITGCCSSTETCIQTCLKFEKNISSAASTPTIISPFLSIIQNIFKATESSSPFHSIPNSTMQIQPDQNTAKSFVNFEICRQRCILSSASLQGGKQPHSQFPYCFDPSRFRFYVFESLGGEPLKPQGQFHQVGLRDLASDSNFTEENTRIATDFSSTMHNTPFFHNISQFTSFKLRFLNELLTNMNFNDTLDPMKRIDGFSASKTHLTLDTGFKIPRGVILQAGIGQSCTEACKTLDFSNKKPNIFHHQQEIGFQWHCHPFALQFINTCAMMQRFFPCHSCVQKADNLAVSSLVGSDHGFIFFFSS